MDARLSQRQFRADLEKLVHRYRLEADLSYNELIGVLEVQKLSLFHELITPEQPQPNDEGT